MEREKNYRKQHKGKTLTEKSMLPDCFLLLVQKTLNFIVWMLLVFIHETLVKCHDMGGTVLSSVDMM